MPCIEFIGPAAGEVVFARADRPDESTEFGHVRAIVCGPPASNGSVANLRLIFAYPPHWRRRPATVCLPAGELSYPAFVALWERPHRLCAAEDHPHFREGKYWRAQRNFAHVWRKNAAGEMAFIDVELEALGYTEATYPLLSKLYDDAAPTIDGKPSAQVEAKVKAREIEIARERRVIWRRQRC